MKFELTTSGYFYKSEKAEKLSKLGFEFRNCEDFYGKTKTRNNTTTIEINSLEELMDFVKEYGEIVLSKDTIEIYDDYRE